MIHATIQKILILHCQSYTDAKKKLPFCLSVVAVIKKIKMSNDLHILGRRIMCQMKQIIIRMKAVCKRNPRFQCACRTSRIRVYFFKTFLSGFIDFLSIREDVEKNCMYFLFNFSLFFICLEFRIIFANVPLACLILV